MTTLIKYKHLFVFFCLLTLYVLFDAVNSGNTGASDAQRGPVYLSMFLLAGWCYSYIFLHKTCSYRHPGYLVYMWAIPVWLFFRNAFEYSNYWISGVHLFIALWWIVAYYYIFKYTSLNPKAIGIIKLLFILILALYIGVFFYAQTNIQQIYGEDNVVLNYSYFIMSFIPFCLLVENRRLRLVLLGVVFAVLIISFKRGPLVILPMMFLVYKYSQVHERKYAFFRMSLQLICFAFVFFLVFTLVDRSSGGFLIKRFSKEELKDGSNRNEMWRIAMDDIEQRDLFTLLVGKGSGSSIKLLGSGCHNEWLEFLFSFGIIGVVLYLGFGFALVNRYRYLLKVKSVYASAFGVEVVFFWCVGLFSGFYFTHSSFYFFAFIGLIEALRRQEIIVNKWHERLSSLSNQVQL